MIVKNLAKKLKKKKYQKRRRRIFFEIQINCLCVCLDQNEWIIIIIYRHPIWFPKKEIQVFFLNIEYILHCLVGWLLLLKDLTVFFPQFYIWINTHTHTHALHFKKDRKFNEMKTWLKPKIIIWMCTIWLDWALKRIKFNHLNTF